MHGTGPTRHIIGVAGSIAAGKSTAVSALSRQFVPILTLNADLIAHDCYLPHTQLNTTIVQTFGQDVQSPSGAIDRPALARLVFADESKRCRLNELVWPAVETAVWRKINQWSPSFVPIEQDQKVLDRPLVLLEAALLLEAGWASKCNDVWVFTTDLETAIARGEERGTPPEEVERRWRRQQETLRSEMGKLGQASPFVIETQNLSVGEVVEKLKERLVELQVSPA